MTNDPQAVEAFIASLYDALGDRKRFDGHLDPAITMWESDAAELLAGLDELDRLRDARATAAPTGGPRPVVFAEPVRTDVFGDVAVARYLLRAQYPHEATAATDVVSPPDERFRVTDVLQRRPDGWRIVHHHSERVRTD